MITKYKVNEVAKDLGLNNKEIIEVLGKFYEEPHYMNIEVIDRVGSGDAYVAGVLYGILSGGSIEKAMAYGNALSAIKNTVLGDMSVSSIDEVDSVIKAHNATGQQDEMTR